jgi:hypothetical protein
MKKILIAFLLIATHIASFAAAPKIIFVENKNQWPGQVTFKADIKGGSIFLEKNTFTYLFVDQNAFSEENHAPVHSKIKSHAFKVNFLNSNPDVQVSGNNAQESVRNYYIGNDPKKWAENAREYTQVHYQELYSSVDMNVYNEEENLKYDFIIQPGGNVKNIKLEYSGPDEMHLEDGHLCIKTSVGLIIEQKPYAYQVVNGQKKQIPCSYELRKNLLSFNLGEYNTSLPLIIDPTLIGSTYSGSTTDNRGYTATYDAAGNIYMGGKAFDVGYPYTIGAGFPGSAMWAITITKFNTNASAIIYSTYIGGGNTNDDQQVHSIIVNSLNQLYLFGRTNSNPSGGPATYPVTPSAVQPFSVGGFDMVVTKLSSTGALLASTYLGGSGDDGVNISSNPSSFSSLKYNFADDGRSEILLDASSNVYVASCTRSANFPCSAGAYDNSLSGTQDAVLFKMNSTLTTLMLSTYLGGSSDDAAYGLKIDNNNNVCVTGGTNSSDFPATAGVLNPIYQGGLSDGFISVINSTGTSLLRSTYLGTSAYDQSFFIDIDASGDLYVFGQTEGSYPVTNGIPSSGQFIHKIKGDLTATIFSTVFGTGGNAVNISPTAFLVDSCQTIYLAGYGRSALLDANMPSPSTTTGLPITTNNLQSTTDGQDFYIMMLAPGGKTLLYSTFFGANSSIDADHADGGTSRFDKHGVLYQAACESSGFPTTIGAYASINYLGNRNEAVFKMDITHKPIASIDPLIPTSGCAPFYVCFDNSGSSCTDFIWDFGDGGVSFINSPCYTYNFGGTYTVTLYCIDSIGSCAFIDTTQIVLHIGVAPTFSISASNILCNGTASSATITVTPTGSMPPLTYTWSPNPQITPVATGLVPGMYSVTVSDAIGCSTTSMLVITQPAQLTTTLNVVNTSSCTVNDGSITALVSGGTPGYTYLWSNGETTTAITGLAQESYTCIISDSNGCTSVLAGNVSCTNAVGELSSETDFTVYPNPTGGEFTISSLSFTEPVELSITNILGEIVFQKTINHKQELISLKKVPSGIYFVNVKTANEITSRKIVKQ